jgi:serine/threonine-protein kinase
VAGLPPGFDGVVARALAKKVDERFQTAREFQAGLLQALQGKIVNATATPARRTETQRPEQASTAVRKAPAIAIAPEALAEIERSLSRHIGPMAKILIQRSQSEAESLGQFFRALAENIPDEEEQRAFMKKMDQVKSNLSTAPAPAEATVPAKPAGAATHPAFTPEVLAAAEKQLATYVGPLARVLIKEAASQSGNLKELYRQLAAHIDEEDERRAFLDSLPR